MMITLNRTGNSITGSYNNSQFGIPFDVDTWNAMVALQQAAEEADSIEQLNEIISDFEALTVITDKQYIETECPEIFVSQGHFYLKTGDQISSIAMPQTLVDSITESLDKDINTDPLIKLWTRWLRNPILRKANKAYQRDFSERFFTYINSIYVSPEKVASLVEDGYTNELAQELATIGQVSVTKEGLIRTFKVSTEINTKFDTETGETINRYEYEYDEDTGVKKLVSEPTNEDRLFQPTMMGTGGDAFYCEGDKGFEDPQHFIRVGCVHRLPSWDNVNTDNHHACVKGLHLGGLNYIRGYQQHGTATHNCLVDPAHIGAIPCASHEGDGAIRVIQYFVLDEFSGVNGSLYHSSEYASKTDEQWKKEREEIIEYFGTLSEAQETEVAEVEAL